MKPQFIDNTVHPMSQVRGARIDMFFGGSQFRATEDVMTMLEQTVPTLAKDENILLINTLCVHRVVATAADILSKGHAGSILVYSASGRLLREKLDFLAKLIVAKKIKMLVLNSWEFAACGSRQKHALAQWIREMRDANELRIVIYSMESKCPEFGALPLLAYTASSVDGVGEWRGHHKYTTGQFWPSATEAVEEYVAGFKAAEAEKATSGFTDQPGGMSGHAGMTMPRKQRESLLNFQRFGDVAGSLKNKELSEVSARELVTA